MSATAAARRYAKALFELAQEDSRVDGVRTELAALTDLLEGNAELRDVLLQPLHPAGQRRAVLNGVVEKLELSPMLRSFYSFVIDQRRLIDLESITTEYSRLADVAAGLTLARIRTASPLSEEQQARLQHALSARTNSNVTLEIEVVPDLLGGLVAQVGDTVFDGSLKTQLGQLRAGLAK